jgi:hypothetical protein
VSSCSYSSDAIVADGLTGCPTTVVVVLRDRLIGAFRLVSLEVRRSDGEISHPLGEHPSGLFIFLGNGNFGS